MNDGNGFILDKTALIAAIAREKSGMIVNVISPLTTTSWDHESPDSIAHLVGQAIEAGAITGPGSAEIVIYPISLEDPGVCQVTIWTGNIKGYAHVIAGQPSLRDLAPESTWRTGGEITLTTTVLERIIEIANTALEDATVLVERKREQAVTGH